MKLQDVVEAYKQGGSKGIRRRKWDPGIWLKLNDHGCMDDLIYPEGRTTTGYHLNVLDTVADDWEVIV